MQNRVGDHSGSVAAKWENAGVHLIQHHAKREQVAARVEVLARYLLGRHICHSTDCLSVTGQHLGRDGGY